MFKRRFLSKIKIREALTYNLWLKLLSLAIAFMVWLFISGEIVKGV